MRQERHILERAVQTLSEQAVKADALVDEALAADPIRVGRVVHKDDERVIAVPEAFRPLIERLDLGR